MTMKEANSERARSGEKDPLVRLLRAVDAQSATPELAADLPDLVRQRRAYRTRLCTMRVVAGVAVALVGVGLLGRGVSTPSPQRPVAVVPRTSPPRVRVVVDTGELARVRAEADALESQIQNWQSALHQQKLASELQRLTNKLEKDASQSACDQAAIIGLCQGDHYWQQHQELEAAREAWQNVIDRFPTTRWATVARQRIEQISMN